LIVRPSFSEVSVLVDLRSFWLVPTAAFASSSDSPSAPHHPQRESARGFNQALVIGRALSKAIGLPVDEVSLMRTAHSDRYRAGLDAKGRQATVENAFAVRYPRLVTGESILLVDDVFTTGATVSSCAEVLIAAGASDVFVLTIARPSW